MAMARPTREAPSRTGEEPVVGVTPWAPGLVCAALPAWSGTSADSPSPEGLMLSWSWSSSESGVVEASAALLTDDEAAVELVLGWELEGLVTPVGLWAVSLLAC